MPSVFYIEKPTLQRIIDDDESEVIYLVQTTVDRETRSLNKWLRRHVDADTLPRWLEPEIFNILLTSRQQVLRVIHAKKYDALIIEQKIYRALPEAEATEVGSLREHYHYLIAVRNNDTMPFSWLENIVYGPLSDNYDFLSHGNIYFSEEEPDRYNFSTTEVGGCFPKREDIRKIVRLLQQLNPRLQSDKLTKHLSQSLSFGYKKNWVEHQKVYLFTKFILPYFCRNTTERQLYIFTKKVLRTETKHRVLRYLFLQETLTAHQQQMLLKYRAILSHLVCLDRCDSFCHFAQLLQDPKTRDEIFADEKTMLFHILVSADIPPKLAKKITQPRYLKCFLCAPYKKKGGSPFTLSGYCALDYFEDFLVVAEKLAELKPTALPRTKTDWHVFLGIPVLDLSIGDLDFTSIADMRTFKKAFFGSTRPTKKAISKEFGEFFDYLQFLYELTVCADRDLKEAHLLLGSERHSDRFDEWRRVVRPLCNMDLITLKKDSDYWHSHIVRISNAVSLLKERQRYELTKHFYPELLVNSDESDSFLVFGKKHFTVAGVEFTQLVSEYEFNLETRQLSHCVASYYGGASRGRYFIFSLKSDEDRSTLQITPFFSRQGDSVSMDLELTQFYSFNNTPPCAKHRRAGELLHSQLFDYFSQNQDQVDALYGFISRQKSHTNLDIDGLTYNYIGELTHMFPALRSLKKVFRSLPDR